MIVSRVSTQRLGDIHFTGTYNGHPELFDQVFNQDKWEGLRQLLLSELKELSNSQIVVVAKRNYEWIDCCLMVFLDGRFALENDQPSAADPIYERILSVVQGFINKESTFSKDFGVWIFAVLRPANYKFESLTDDRVFSARKISEGDFREW